MSWGLLTVDVEKLPAPNSAKVEPRWANKYYAYSTLMLMFAFALLTGCDDPDIRRRAN